MNTAYTDHLALYDLLVARDLRGAKRALSRHIKRVKKHVLAGLSRVIREQSLPDF